MTPEQKLARRMAELHREVPHRERCDRRRGLTICTCDVGAKLLTSYNFFLDALGPER